MDALGIQSRINRGAAIATRYLGTSYAWYRPGGAGNPLAAANRMGSIACDMKADYDFTGSKPALYAKPIWAALYDRTSTQVGDYLVGFEGVFFVAAQQLHTPAAVINCNRVLTFARPGSGAPGADYYGGDLTSTETGLLTGWPAAVLQGTKGQVGATNLPGDERLPWVAIWLPPTPVQLRAADFATDDQDQPMRYEVSGAENTSLGWRLTASLAVT